MPGTRVVFLMQSITGYATCVPDLKRRIADNLALADACT